MVTLCITMEAPRSSATLAVGCGIPCFAHLVTPDAFESARARPDQSRRAEATDVVGAVPVATAVGVRVATDRPSGGVASAVSAHLGGPN
jgi:hypothetical protein